MTSSARLAVIVAAGIAMVAGPGCKHGLQSAPSTDGSAADVARAGGGAAGGMISAGSGGLPGSGGTPGTGGASDAGAMDVAASGGAQGGADAAAMDHPMPSCAAGQHLCPGGCVANDDVQTCGASCTPCQAPANGTATCDGTSCGGACPANMQLCLGACIDAAAACTGKCSPTQHACGGLCPALNDPKACGTSCQPCPVPAGATQATCDGTSCGFQCVTGTHRCGAGCADDGDATACGASCTVCPTDPHGTAQCTGGTCEIACNDGYHSCGGVCVSNSAVESCGSSSCTACQAPMGGTVSCNGTACVPACPSGMKPCAGACVATSAACSGQCPSGTHDCSGVCASNTSVDSCGTTACTSCSKPVGASGTTCDGTSCDFTCGSGYHRCGARCAADDDATACGAMCTNCPGDANGAAACVSGNCALKCKTGFHVCNGACVDNKGLATCGPNDNGSCSACAAPTGGTVTCEGLACNPACPTGSKICNGVCISNSTACNGSCPTGTHNCSGICLSDTDPGSCGTQCFACPAPSSHGQATCGAGACGVSCDSTYRLCPGTSTCASKTAPACCTAADCTAGGTGTVGTCTNNVCSYSCNTPSYKQCGSACIASTSCCTPCTNGFACQGGTCPTSCSTNNDCAANHSCQHGACIGKIVQLSLGYDFACTLHDDGAVRCWGYNGDGELGGTGGPGPMIVPLPMAATQISASNRLACAVLADTSLWCWGLPDGNTRTAPAPLFSLTGVKTVALSFDVGGCVILTTGGVTCWGRNEVGQLGLGTVAASSATLSPPNPVPGISTATQLSHSGGTVCVLLTNGNMVCWGSNSQGQIGNGSFDSSGNVVPSPEPSPTTVPNISGAVQMSTSGVDSYALLGGANAGALMSLGNDLYAGRGGGLGQLFTPGRMAGTTQFASICSQNTQCAMTTTGTVMCWGYNDQGQVGVPASTSASTSGFVYDPVAVAGLTSPTSVACGGDFNCAITNAGLGVMCWGSDKFGQLGDGMTGAGGNVPTAVAW